MDYHNDLIRNLIEMFPDVPKTKIKCLVKSGDDINVIITRILDNNIESPVYNINELVYSGKTHFDFAKSYNYPEVYEKVSNISVLEDVPGLRKAASELCKKSIEMAKNAASHEIKSTRIYYSIESEKIMEEANELNYKAAIILMRRAIESQGAIDLHGLTVKEANLFLDDLYNFRKFTEITVVTGQAYKSSRLRPAMEKWFKIHGFTTIDRGASLEAKKK